MCFPRLACYQHALVLNLYSFEVHEDMQQAPSPALLYEDAVPLGFYHRLPRVERAVNHRELARACEASTASLDERPPISDDYTL